jgi:hypothetical protein
LEEAELIDRDFKHLIALHESEADEHSKAVLEKVRPIISALKKRVQAADDIVYQFFEMDHFMD